MVDRHDYVALEWVKGEIAETLKQAYQALEHLADDPQALDALDQCLEGIHQVHGSLQMVEFYGAALLAEEMEKLALALQQQRVAQRDEALRLLRQAISQLPQYLDRVQSARRDLPLVVLPLLNDLRSARGESLLSETSLFSPQLPSLPPLSDKALAALEPLEFPTQLRKLRHMLQTALVDLLREQDADICLGHMAKVFERLEALCQDAPLAPLWHIASALVEGMRQNEIANSPAVRSLLKDADKELKRLLEQGMPGINQAAPAELLKSLLFYIAKARHPTPLMLTMKERYGLDDALPDSAVVDEERARMAGPDRDAMRSVLAAVCDGLVRVKERLDLFVRSDRQHAGDLDSLLSPLRQIADTLAVAGVRPAAQGDHRPVGGGAESGSGPAGAGRRGVDGCGRCPVVCRGDPGRHGRHCGAGESRRKPPAHHRPDPDPPTGDQGGTALPAAGQGPDHRVHRR